MSIFLPQQKAFGLDISDYVMRLAYADKDQIVTAGEIELPTGLISKGIIKNPEKVAEYIDQLVHNVKGRKIKTKYVVACLPEQRTFIKVIDLPPYDKTNFQNVLAEEIVKHIPYEINEIYIDWQKLPTTSGNKILIGVTPKDIVISYQNLLAAARLMPVALEIEAASISRCLIQEKKSQTAKIILDIGFNRTSLIVYDNETVQFSISIPISGDVISKSIASTLSLDYQEAEKAKIVCGFDEHKCDQALVKILKPVMERLILNINEAITFYQNHFTNRHEIKEIILCGGGANFKNLDKIIMEKTSLTVAKGDIFTNLSQPPKKEIMPPKNYLSYVSAVGLALYQKNV